MSLVRGFLLATPRRRAATLFCIALVFALVIFELVSQAVAFVELGRLQVISMEPSHYYQSSDNPVLAYELKRDFSLDGEGRRLHINKAGFREDSDEKFADKYRVAIMGDSVVFGIGLSQEQTISALLQQRIDPNTEKTKILNSGLPGLGLAEFPEYLHFVHKAYSPQAVIYILNPNDFVIRDTLYEGADNGLYRTYRHPLLKSPWMIRKAVYRLKKGGVIPTTGWYRWTFDGTKRKNLKNLHDMAAMAKVNSMEFYVVFLPVRASFEDTDKTIPDIYRELGNDLTRAGISWTDPVRTFAVIGGAKGLITETDHLTAEGRR